MSYPVWWDTTITIYNKYEDRQTQLVRWFRHTINNCFWKASNNKVTINDTVLDSSNILCRIPKSGIYMEKYDWEQLPNDIMSEYFTLGQGDIIIKGVIDFEIDEYVKGKRSTDLLEKYKYKGCMQIERFSDNTGYGRNDEHYYVTGT
jgi:hypothetical protein